MKRFYVLTIALATTLLASVFVAATPASAVEFALAIWLESGNPITAQLAVENEGEFEFTSTNGGGLGVKVKVLCSGILDGWISNESLGFISELLTLSGVGVSLEPLTGTALLCANTENCAEPEVWADVPFETETEEMLDGEEFFFADLIFKASWYVECLILGAAVSELCEAEPGVAKLTNEAGGTVDAEFSDAFQVLAGGKLATCTNGGAETGEMNGLEIVLVAGTSLSVSEEGLPVLLVEKNVENPLKIKETVTETFTIIFDGNLKSGKLTVLLQPMTPFEYKGGTCNGGEIDNKGSCTVMIKCTGKKGEKGELDIKSSRLVVPTLERKLECT